MHRTVLNDTGIQHRSPDRRYGEVCLKTRAGLSSCPLDVFFGFCLEVALQQAGDSLAVTGLVAGHLSRRRAGRFASYGGSLEK